MVAAGADRARRVLDGPLSRELPEADARRHRARRPAHGTGCAGRRFAPDAGQAGPAGAPPAAREGSGALMGRLAPLLPELILSIGGTILMLVAAFAGRRGTGLTSWLSVALLLAATAALVGAPSHAGPIYDGLIAADLFASFGKAIIFPAAAVAVIAGHGWFERDHEHGSEYAVLIV